MLKTIKTHQIKPVFYHVAHQTNPVHPHQMIGLILESSFFGLVQPSQPVDSIIYRNTLHVVAQIPYWADHSPEFKIH